MPPTLPYLLRRLRRQPPPSCSDGDAALLDRFVRLRDEDAFAALVARHGPMVLNACRRLLGDAHEAEDAFQATFLILARRAGGLRRPEALAGWLYGVASRVAREARRRKVHCLHPGLMEALDPPDPRPDPLADVTARDLLRVLEEEVQRLPGTYRLPVVLCCLEGLSQEEAAHRLGCTAGSIRGRLERGRRRLHARLVRRGLTLAAALGVAEVARGAARALPATTTAAVTTTGRGPVPAAGLAERVLKGMVFDKLKFAAVVLAFAALAVGAGLLTPRSPAVDETPSGPVRPTTKEARALARLLRSLGDGPIQVRPAHHGARAVSRRQAIEAAKAAIGCDGPPAHAWRVAVTDREFPGGLVKSRSCWLLSYPGAVTLHLDFEGQQKRRLGLYVVVDAATGRCWEAFTEPSAPWWKRVRQRNDAVVRAFAGGGDEAAPDPRPPGVPLLHLLNARASAIPGFEYGAQRQAQQVVARRFLYTTPVDTEERVGGSVRRVRSHDREPVWFVEFAGVNLAPPKGPPESPPRMPRDERPATAAPPRPNVERVELRLNASTGRLFTTTGSP